MRLSYKNPWLALMTKRWKAFEEQARRIAPYLQRFGYRIEHIKYLKIPDTESWKFSAFFRSSSRIIHISLITSEQQEGAVSFFIYPTNNEESRGISFYKYLRKHFRMVPRRGLFLSRYRGDFSDRLQKVLQSYVKLSQFYAQSILHGLRWDDTESDSI